MLKQQILNEFLAFYNLLSKRKKKTYQINKKDIPLCA